METKHHNIFTSHVIGCFYMCTKISTYENKVTLNFFTYEKKAFIYLNRHMGHCTFHM